MAFPNPVPSSAANCVLYGFVRDASGTGAQNVSVLIGPPELRAEQGPVTVAATDAGEGLDENWIEALTDADGYWEVELRRNRTVRVVIQRLKLDITNLLPDVNNQDFQFWAFQPVMSGSRQFTADPVGAPAVVDTSVIVQIPSATLPLVLQLFDQIMIYEATTRNGVYTEVSAAATRLVIEDNREFYEFTRDSIDPGRWYKARFLDSTSARMGPLSLPLRGVAPDYATVTTIEELKAFYLYGVDLTDDSGNPYSRGMYERYIRDAISWFSRSLDLSLAPAARTERQDFHVADFVEWEFLQLDKIPVLAVDLIEHVIGDQVMLTIPADWIVLDQESGQVRLVPQAGSLQDILMMAGGGRYLGSVGLIHSSFPGYIRITYRYGYALGTIPEEFKHVISMLAALGPLNIAGDLLGGAGVASWSLGMDGVHQSISTTSSATNAGYGARVQQYLKEIKLRMAGLTRYYNGIRFVVA